MSARQWTGVADRGTLGAVPWTRAAPYTPRLMPRPRPRGRGTLLFHTSGRAKSPPAPLHAFGVEYVGIYPFGDNGTGHKIPVTPTVGGDGEDEEELLEVGAVVLVVAVGDLNSDFRRGPTAIPV